MDSRTAPTASDPLVAMLQNASIDKAERSEFSNSARDMFKIVLNNYVTKEEDNPMHDSSDPVNHLLKVIPLLLAEIRKNDQTQSPTVSDITAATGKESLISQDVATNHTMESDPVNIIDMVPPEPLSLPVTSMSDRYTRCMLKCLAGYPLYEPEPFSDRSKEYSRHGANVGDVGFIRGDGVFDFLFNVCPPQNSLINPPILPDGSSLDTSEDSETRTMRPFPHETYLFQSPVIRTKYGEYICEGPEGAILELPDGAIQEEATNLRPFEMLAARHGVQWYKYTLTRGRKISNGSLYLITSFTKCAQWGIAVFDRPCAPGQGLRFDKKRSFLFRKSSYKYHWKGSRVFHTKASDLDQGDVPNQCVFLRGYKIMIRQDIFDNLCNGQPRKSAPAMLSSLSQAGGINVTRQPATRIRGGGGPDPMLKRSTGGSLSSGNPLGSMAKPGAVMLQPNFNSSLVHPSDLINAALLSQNLDVKVALTHDDVWCDLLRDNFPNFDHGILANISRSYTIEIDEYDYITLQKFDKPSNVLEESHRPFQGIVALQGPLAIDYTRPLAANSLTLPRELVERILILLEPDSMLKCRLVNREFNEIIQSSTLLQYHLTCKAASVINNPLSHHSYVERLETLKARECAWRTLKPVFEKTIQVNHEQSGIYGLSAGTYFLADNNRKNLYYCYLPSYPYDNQEWIRIPGYNPEEARPGIITSFAEATYEYDLIINIILSDIGESDTMQRYSLDLVALKLSTGDYHPFATHRLIHVQRSHSVQNCLYVTIVGDDIALIVTSEGETDKLFIFDWKTGDKRLQHETEKDTYTGLDFISPELLLVPNISLFHFEVWYLPPSPQSPIQILSLKIPLVSPDYFLFSITCFGEPRPSLRTTTMPYFPPRPFFSTWENAIIVANFRFESILERERLSYSLIMHRHVLVDMIQKRIPSSLLEKHEDLPTGAVNEIIWEDWGPPISRWLEVSETQAWRFTTSFGQRYAFLDPSPNDSGKSIVGVVDFNLKRNLQMMTQLGEEGEDNRGAVKSEARGEERDEEMEILDHKGVFSEQVSMGLNCVVHFAPGKYDFDAVLMDEERLLGLKIDRDGVVQSIKVLYFG